MKTKEITLSEAVGGTNKYQEMVNIQISTDRLIRQLNIEREVIYSMNECPMKRRTILNNEIME